MHFTFHIVKLKLNEMENTSTEMHCALLIFIRIYFVITLSLFSTLRFVFSTETLMCHLNHQGMEVGVWDGMNLTVLLTLLIFNI